MDVRDLFACFRKVILKNSNLIKLFRPDTFVYTTADQTGFLLPQVGAYFVVSYQGKFAFI